MSVKYAFRTLAKRFHPDKDKDSDATEVFQKLNNAYQVLRNSSDSSVPRHGDECNHTDSDHTALPNISIIMRENSFSVTVDITDIMFLAFVDECQKHYCVNPVDRGHNGLQFRFEYTSPDDATEHYGTISLTFYGSTSRLLVQGTSYLLWINEHLPIIYTKAEWAYEEDIGKWHSLARRRGIGVKRVTRQTLRGQGLPSNPMDDNAVLPTSPGSPATLPYSPNTIPLSPNCLPSSSDQVSLSATVSPHVVYDTPSVASHEAPSPPIPGQELCLTSSLVPFLRPLEFLPANDPSRGDPSQDEPSPEDVVGHGCSRYLQQGETYKTGWVQWWYRCQKDLDKKKWKRNPRKREKRRSSLPTLQCHIRPNIRLVNIVSPAVRSKIQKIVIWYDAQCVWVGSTPYALERIWNMLVSGRAVIAEIAISCQGSSVSGQWSKNIYPG